MRDQAGFTFVADAIWTTGLPRLPSFATEQHGKQLPRQDVEVITEAIHNIMNWYDHLANMLIKHWQTKKYHEGENQELQNASQVSEQQSRRREQPLAK